MKESVYFISYSRADALKTEILFRIASARAEQSDLIRMDVNGSEDDRDQIYFRAKRILKDAKKEGTIQTYAFPADFEKETTEAVYLLNLYPELEEEIRKAEYPYFIIKL